MKVYIVLSHYPHEGQEIEGIFMSEDSAQKLTDTLTASSKKRYDGLVVEFIESEVKP